MKMATKRIVLVPLSENHLESIFKWRNSPSYRMNCSVRRIITSWQDFLEELDVDFSTDRHLQYVALSRKTEEMIGTIYSYNFNSVDGHVFITIFIDDQFQGTGVGVDIFILFLSHLFEHFKLHKVYTEVYEYNTNSLFTMIKGGFKEEGRFKEHRFVNGKRYDLIRLAYYYQDIDKVINTLSKLT